jgi:glycosyltransferase involved in cell wall biosynthesis
MKHIWLVSFFEPTPYDKQFSARFINIADELVKKGNRVTFFSSTFRHFAKAQRFNETTRVNVREGYDLLFVKTLSYKGNISLRRVLSHSLLSREMIREMIREMNNTGEKPDVIFMAFPPIASAYRISEWAVDRGIPYIVDIIDPWPDSHRRFMKPVPHGIQDVLLTPYVRRNRKIFGNAAAVTGIANEFLEWSKKYNPEANELHAFYPSADLSVVQEKLNSFEGSIEKDDKLRVIYAGSFASSYDIPTILEAAKALSSDYTGKIEFVIAGAGPQETKITEYCSRHQNLRYTGRLSKEDLLKEYYKADLGLIQHFPGATQTVTYKLFDLLSCGLPVLNSLNSELNDILLDNEVGFYNESGDYKQLAENILYCYNHPEKLKEMQERAVRVTAELGDTKKVYAEAAELIIRMAEPEKAAALHV